MTEREIFTEALRRADPRQQAAFLDEACAGESALRLRIESLLAEQQQLGSFLEDPPVALLAQPIAERPGMKIGPYKLLQQIGEGGMGVVFMAEQSEPVRRKVALKVIRPGMDTRQVIARFTAERQTLAVMDHPNIARVLEAGATESCRPYFVMELVQGVPITAHCDDNNLPVHQRLELFASVCQAIHHAHTKGVIHRDIKPTNVLVATQDGHAVVKVIDFGIAKAIGPQLAEKSLVTDFTQMIGTPLYMSPEQAELANVDIDTRSDVYSLGVLLYELLTGSTPFGKERFDSAGFDEIRRIIRQEDPARPSTRISSSQTLPTIAANRHVAPARLASLVRGELDWIVMKCLEKDRNRRYESAASLAADVRRLLRGEPVQACPSSIVYRFRKLARRHRGALISVSVAAFAATIALSALAVSSVLVWRANGDLTRSLLREQQEANFHRITLAHRDLSADNLGRALSLLEACPVEQREWEWHYLMRLCRVEPLVIRDTTEITAVAFSPDGQRLASAGGDGAIKLWNSRTGEQIDSFEAHTNAVLSVVFHPNGRYLASCGADQLVKVWDLSRTGKGEEIFTGPCDATRKFGTAYSIAFRPPDGSQIAAGIDGSVRVWDWKQQQLVRSFPGHGNHPVSVAFSGDGRQLAASAGRNGQKLWDAETAESLLRTFPAHRHPVSAVTFRPDSDQLASASFDRSVKLWDTVTGELVHTFGHTGNVLCTSFSPDGRRLASAGEDKTVRVWDTATGREVLALRGHTGMCGCVAFSPDGHRLASASIDQSIRIWDARPLEGDERQEMLTFSEHHDEIRSVDVSPDGHQIASAGFGTDVKIWGAESGEVSITLDAHAEVVFCLAWHPTGHRLAATGWPNHTVQVWDTRDGRPLFTLPPGRECFALAFSPDGHYLVTGRGDGAIQIWDAAGGRQVNTLGAHGWEIRGLVFSPDGQLLASASSDGTVKLWDAKRLDITQDRARLSLQTRMPGPGLTMAFSQDSQRLATGGEENTVKIWDVLDGQLLQTLRGHSGEVYALAFSPDQNGRWLVSAGEDSAVKVWDSHSGAFIRNLRGHTGLVSSMAFSPDSRRLVSGSRDTTVKIWDMTQLGGTNHGPK